LSESTITVTPRIARSGNNRLVSVGDCKEAAVGEAWGPGLSTLHAPNSIPARQTGSQAFHSSLELSLMMALIYILLLILKLARKACFTEFNLLKMACKMA
jgi:hypothetical protein